VNLKSDNQKAC